MTVTAAERGADRSTKSAPPATFYVVVGGNDYYWRAQAPAEVIGAQLAVIPEHDADHALMSPNTDTAFPWQMRALAKNGRQSFETHLLDTEENWKIFNRVPREIVRMTCEFPEHQGGAAVFTRPDLPRAVLARAMRMQGIRTIAETDDNYFIDPRYNLFARQQGMNAETHLQHGKAMASMDANIFSTAWLRDRYYQQYRKFFAGHPWPEPFVCRNHIPRSHWPVVPEYDGPLRVGFMGSPSHVWDIHRGYASFHAAKYLGCTTTVIGYNPADPDPHIPESVEADGKTWQLRSKKSLAVSRKWSNVIDNAIDWVAPDDYHRAALPLDIGLAPLRPKNDFILGKSDVKAIEYTISGAACVLSKNPIYESAGWKHEVNCLFGASQEGLALQVVRLLRDPKLRAELVQNAQQMVREERNETVMRSEWEAALNG